MWILRISIGVVFIASGLAKTIDLWGTVYKIEEYLKVWHMWQPRSLVFMASFLLAGIEFVLGSLLLIGAYRRASVWLLLLMMCGMLPLTLYI
ncbi:MAG: DoxX family membrane protein, partial [Paramuribaculum sp.]|nr:DoxX family membrane protein [Paramuribaculum sp.]